MHSYTRKEQWCLWNKATKRRRGWVQKDARNTPNNTLAITDPCKHTSTLCSPVLLLTHKQERKSYYLEMSPDIACHTVRGLDQDLLTGPPTQHTHTNKHTRFWNWGGVKKAWSHVGGKGGTRQHLQSPLLIALLPAWSQITGLEMLQSGLYLLANLPHPQIHTSKPPSYHLLVNLHQRKRTPWYSEVELLLSISSFLFVGIFLFRGGEPLLEVRCTHDRVFFRTWKGSGQCCCFCCFFSSSPWVAALMSEDWSHKSLSIYYQRASANSGLGRTPHG